MTKKLHIYTLSLVLCSTLAQAETSKGVATQGLKAKPKNLAVQAAKTKSKNSVVRTRKTKSKNSATQGPKTKSKNSAVHKRIQQYEHKLKKQPDHIALRQRLAELYKRLKQADKIIDTLAPYANEIDLRSYTTLAYAYKMQKNDASEIKAWQAIIKKQQPPSFRPHFALAQVYKKNKQNIEAEEQYKKALQMAPKHLPSFNALFDLYFQQDDYDTAKQLVLKQIELLGERKNFLHKLCAVHIENNFIQEGVKACTKAVEAESSYPESPIYLARALRALGQELKAEKMMNQTARKFTNSEFVQWSVGEYFFQKQQYTVAARYLKKAVQIKAQSARSLLALAMALFHDKKYTQALPMYLRSCKNDSTRASLMELRTAIAYLRQNNQPAMAQKFSKQEHRCSG